MLSLLSRLDTILVRISPLQYVAACVIAVLLSPSSFLVVWLTVVIIYHVVLSQVGFVEVEPTSGQTSGADDHALLRAYRGAAPVLVIAGLLLYLLDLPDIGGQMSGVLIATGTGLILGVKTISFAGTGV